MSRLANSSPSSKPILVGLLLLFAAALSAAQGTARYASGVTLRDGYLPEYVEPVHPDFSKIIYIGDAVSVEWELHNGLDDPHEYRLPQEGVGGLLEVSVMSVPPASQSVRFVVESIDRRTPTTIQRIAVPTDRLRIGAMETLYIRGMLVGIQVPGLHELRFRVGFRGPFAVVDRLNLDVRQASSRADRAEVAYRRMVLALGNGDCAAARQESERLLSIHPGSSVALQGRAHCSRLEGNRAQAADELAQALEFLRLGEDDLLIERKSPLALQRRRDELEASVAALARP